MSLPDLLHVSISELQRGLSSGVFSSVQLTNAYLARIDEVNTRGPQLRAVNAISPVALEAARELDEERKRGKSRGILHGIPILIKDHIPPRAEDGMSCTFGSLALAGAVVSEEATLVTRLRQAGAIILGLTNLSEWGWMRGYGMKDQIYYPCGWSGVGGQNLNPYGLHGNTMGSSSGSATAAAAGLAAAAIGSDGNGSLTTPAAAQNVVTIRTTPGMISSEGMMGDFPHVVSLGPIGRSVEDVAHVLTAISEPDPRASGTRSQAQQATDFAKALDKYSLKGARLGIIPDMRKKAWTDTAALEPIFLNAVAELRKLGAEVVDDIPFEYLAPAAATAEWFPPLLAAFEITFSQYLAKLKANPNSIKGFADVIAYNDAHPDTEKPPGCEDQSALQAVSKSDSSDPEAVFSQLQRLQNEAAAHMTKLFEKHRLDAIVFPLVVFNFTAWARAGAPIAVVPMGFMPSDVTVVSRTETEPVIEQPFAGMPQGLAFGGLPRTDSRLLSFAYAFEQATQFRRQRLPIPSAIPNTQLTV